MRIHGVLFGLASFPFVANAELISGLAIRYGNWSGAAYSYDTTGTFSHCAISAVYNSGETLILTVNEDATVSVGVISPNLNMTVGQTFPVALYIDNRSPMFGTAEALDANFAALRLDDFDRAITALQKGQMLVLDTPLGTGNYDLTGTYRALQSALQCAMDNLSYSSGPPQPEQVSPNNGADQTVLYQIATEMITQTGATGFRYLSKEEMATFVEGDAVYWSSEKDGILGGVQIVPLGAEQNLRSSDAGDIAFAGAGCAGEVATSTRNLAGDEFESREIRALCIEDGQEKETLVTKTLLGQQILYTVLMFSGASQQIEAKPRQELSEDVAIRAASFVRELGTGN